MNAQKASIYSISETLICKGLGENLPDLDSDFAGEVRGFAGKLCNFLTLGQKMTVFLKNHLSKIFRNFVYRVKMTGRIRLTVGTYGGN